jgi:hypothetical protein
MTRTHALLISLVLAAAVVLGGLAAIRSTQLSASASSPKVSSTQISRQNAALDRAQARLRAELRSRPPALPAAAAARPAAVPQTVVYKRAPAIVRVIHRHGGHENEAEHGREHEGSDD